MTLRITNIFKATYAMNMFDSYLERPLKNWSVLKKWIKTLRSPLKLPVVEYFSVFRSNTYTNGPAEKLMSTHFFQSVDAEKFTALWIILKWAQLLQPNPENYVSWHFLTCVLGILFKIDSIVKIVCHLKSGIYKARAVKSAFLSFSVFSFFPL